MTTNFRGFENIQDVPFATTNLNATWSDKKVKEGQREKEKVHEGRTYVIVETKTRTHKTLEKTLLGVAATVGTLGFGLLSQNVRNNLTGKEVEKFGVLKEKATEYTKLKNDNNLPSAMTAEKISQLDVIQVKRLFPLESTKVGTTNEQQKEITKEQLEKLSPDAFKALLPQLKGDYYSIIPDNHLNNLDFANMKRAQIDRLFVLSSSPILSDRLALIDDKNIKLLLPNLLNNPNFDARSIPNEYIYLLDFKSVNLDEKQIMSLFKISSPPSDVSKERFARLSTGQVNDLLNQNPSVLSNLIINHPKLITLFSRVQLQNTDVKHMYDNLLKAIANKYQTRPDPSQARPGASQARPLPEPVRNPYEVLGVTGNSSPGDIRKAYFKLAREHHPDRVKRNVGESDESFKKRVDDNTAEMQKIIAAYERMKER